jgi:lipopolysaccharide export system permease protein
MSILSRYLLRQNIFLLLAILLAGVGLYVLTDLFERLDNFWESGAGVSLVLLYFCVKIPTIVSQILPAVFLLSLVVQLNFLARAREQIALAAGGVSPAVLFRFVFLYGVLIASAQFSLAQVLGVAGERAASRIWQEDVRGRVLAETIIEGVWFTEKNYIVHIGEAYPAQRKGANLLVYSLDETGFSIDEILRASRFTVSDDGEKWILEDGGRLIPAQYANVAFTRFELPLRQDLLSFQVAARSGGIRHNQLSLGDLKETILRLEQAGSNVEGLRTVWHGKLSYAGSIVVMGILALLVSRLTPNIYKATGISLLLVFLFFGLNTIGVSLGEKGIVTPFLGAWFADLFFACTGLLGLALSSGGGADEAGLY